MCSRFQVQADYSIHSIQPTRSAVNLMLVLGIETSGSDGSVALSRDGILLGERELSQMGRRHAQGLVLEISELLQEHGSKPRDINLVAVSRGPGSFTGLRIGMVCAKTIAYSTGCRFIAVDTFAAIAAGVSKEVQRLHVIEDAQKEDLFLGEYSRDSDAEWQQASPIRIVSVSEFFGLCQAPIIVTGPGLKKLETFPRPDKRYCASEIPAFQPRAGVIADLGRTLLMNEEHRPPVSETDFWVAAPFYLRLSAAEEKQALQANSVQGAETASK